MGKTLTAKNITFNNEDKGIYTAFTKVFGKSSGLDNRIINKDIGTISCLASFKEVCKFLGLAKKDLVACTSIDFTHIGDTPKNCTSKVHSIGATSGAIVINRGDSELVIPDTCTKNDIKLTFLNFPSDGQKIYRYSSICINLKGEDVVVKILKTAI